MALLDFIKNRNASQQQTVAKTSQEPKPETAKEMYSRQAAQEKLKPMDRMPADQQAKVEAIKANLERATQHIDKNAQSPSTAPADSMGNREAMRQNQTGQDKAAPALSPTSAQAGQPSTESPANSPVKSPEKTEERTLPRPRPSWER